MDLTPTQITRFWSFVARDPGDDGHWLWRGRLDRGVPAFGSANDKALRLAYELQHGPIPATTRIYHIPTCPRLCIRHGVAGQRPANTVTTYSDEIIATACQDYATGHWTVSALATHHGMSVSHLSNVLRGKNRHVPLSHIPHERRIPVVIPTLSPRAIRRFWSYVRDYPALPPDPSACWAWDGPVTTEHGGHRYPHFILTSRSYIAARVLYTLLHGSLQPAAHLFHEPTCPDPLCIRHYTLAGRSRPTIPFETITTLRAAYATGNTTITALAHEYGLSLGHTSDILHHRVRQTR